ncbi:helicase RepA family protein, partial [bacterium]|nr:helicase RepA family protein [bacterium]
IKEKGYKMLVIDVIVSAHTGNENSASDMRLINRRMIELINSLGITILYLHHHRKGKPEEGHNIHSARGSSELIAKVSSHLVLESKEFPEKNIFILEQTLTQHKSRNVSWVNSFTVRAINNLKTGKTYFEWMGEDYKKNQRIKKVEKYIMSIMKQNKKYTIKSKDGELTNDIMANVKNDKKDITETAVRETIKSLLEKGTVELTESKSNKKYYQLVINKKR